MFRFSFLVLVIASALALNGCSQCSKQEGTEVPAAAPVEATPVDAAAVPAAPADAMPAATPADAMATPAPEATPAQ